MAWLSVPPAPAGERWYRQAWAEPGRGGYWHLGAVRAGRTWPAGPGRCGHQPPPAVRGEHKTALMVTGPAEEICPPCLASLRHELRGGVRR